MGGLVVGRFPAGIATSRKRTDLPPPLENTRLIEIDRIFEIGVNGNGAGRVVGFSNATIFEALGTKHLKLMPSGGFS